MREAKHARILHLIAHVVRQDWGDDDDAIRTLAVDAKSQMDARTARLRAWEPVVRTAQEYIAIGAMLDKDWTYLHALGDAIRALPPEHRPGGDGR